MQCSPRIFIIQKMGDVAVPCQLGHRYFSSLPEDRKRVGPTHPLLDSGFRLAELSLVSWVSLSLPSSDGGLSWNRPCSSIYWFDIRNREYTTARRHDGERIRDDEFTHSHYRIGYQVSDAEILFLGGIHVSIRAEEAMRSLQASSALRLLTKNSRTFVELTSFWITWLMTQMLFSYCRSEASASSISVPACLVRSRGL
jgi:hypothetical protein